MKKKHNCAACGKGLKSPYLLSTKEEPSILTEYCKACGPIIESIKKHAEADCVESDIEEAKYWLKRDKDQPHRKLSAFSRKWIEQWVKQSNGEADHEPLWYLDTKTWSTYRQAVDGKWVNGEDYVPGQFILDGEHLILKSVYSGGLPSKYRKYAGDKGRKMFLKAYEKRAQERRLIIPISEVVLVKR